MLSLTLFLKEDSLNCLKLACKFPVSIYSLDMISYEYDQVYSTHGTTGEEPQTLTFTIHQDN